MQRGNKKNLNLIRTSEEAIKRGRNGGIKSGESRRRKKAEKDSLKKLLALVPNIDIFLENPKNKAMFDMLGIKEKDIPNIETLTDLKLIQGALNGDLKSKKYIDERVGKSPQLELKRQSVMGEFDINLDSDSNCEDEGNAFE